MTALTVLKSVANANERAMNHQFGVSDARRMLNNISRSIDDGQLVREMLHNMFHAIGPLGKGSITICVTPVSQVPKLTFVDDGVGMNAEDILNYIGNMSSSSRTDTDRFGCGGKLTGMNTSPEGLEYISWNGKDAPVRAVLADDGHAISFRVLDVHGNRIVPVPVKSLHETIRKAGHGTMVIIHGRHAAENTFQTMLDVVGAGKLKGYSRYFNGKYATFPKQVSVKLAARRSKNAGYIKTPGNGTPMDGRTDDNVGLMSVLDQVADSKGQYVSAGWTAHWFHVPNARSQRRLDHGDNCWNHGLVAVSYPDSEIPGLREVYDLAVGTSGTHQLSRFGLGQIAKDVAVVVEITDPVRLGFFPNLERTMLVRDGKKFEVDEFAQEFRDNMPSDLADLVDAAIAARSINLSEELAKLVSQNPDLFDPSRLAAFPAAPGVTGKVGGQNAKRSSSPSAKSTSSADPDKKRSRRASVPSSKGAAAAALIPTVTTWNDIDDEYKFCFAMWDATSNCLMVNDDFEQIDRETDWQLHQRGKVHSKSDRKVARELVREQMVLTALEAIIQARLVQRHDVDYEDNWDFALTPQGITMAVMPALCRRQVVAKNIGMKLGRTVR